MHELRLFALRLIGPSTGLVVHGLAKAKDDIRFSVSGLQGSPVTAERPLVNCRPAT